MSTSNLDSFDLGGVPVGGTINEDLMQKIYDVSPVDRPFLDAIGSMTSDNTYKEWIREDLAAAVSTNKRVDGSDSSALNDTRTGERLGNYHQLMSKTVRVSDRGRDVNTVGSSDELVRQLMKRQKELKRDEEAALTSSNEAISGDSSTASQTAGVGAWIGTGQSATNTDRGVGGADPILSGNPGGAPTTGPVAGTKRALSEATVKSMVKAAYLKGGDITMAMSTPAVIDVFSNRLFASTAVAQIQTQVDQSNTTNASSGNGNAGGGVVAQGSVNIFVTNFGTMELVPNRFQEDSSTGAADLYLLDPSTWEASYLSGYRTKELARNGLAENREITVDVTLCALNEEANAVVADIDYTVAATA